MPTAAKIYSEEASHYYWPDGRSCHEVPYADPKKGVRPTTLRDAKKLGLLPSVTTLCKILDKPALTAWKVEQAVLTVLTSPRLPDEATDAFVKRVLQVDREQDAEASKARELGSFIHESIENALNGEDWISDVDIYVRPVLEALKEFGKSTKTEMIVVGNGYAGRVDCVFETDSVITIIDFKTTKNLPKESYPEAKLQLSAYAAGLGNTGNKIIQTANIYISTTEAGKIAIFAHDDWQETFRSAFVPLQKLWGWINDYQTLSENNDIIP